MFYLFLPAIYAIIIPNGYIYNPKLCKNNKIGAIAMIQQLRPLVLLLRNRFSSQAPTCSSQLSMTQIPGTLTHSSDLCGHQANTEYTYIYAGKKHTHIK